MSYQLASSIRDELKSDERLVAGVLSHPDLSNPNHENSVLQTTVFNKSKRKCFVSKVEVCDSQGNAIEIDWASVIDSCGNPQGKSQLIGVVDEAALFIRRRDAQAFISAVVNVTHSFDGNPLVLKYDMESSWNKYFAKTST